jgi:hypothetical protein
VSIFLRRWYSLVRQVNVLKKASLELDFPGEPLLNQGEDSTETVNGTSEMTPVRDERVSTGPMRS